MNLPLPIQAMTSPYDGPHHSLCAPADRCRGASRLAAGGACLWQAWVRLEPGERMDQDTGVDFTIYHLRLADGRVVTMFQGGPSLTVDGRPAWRGEHMPVLLARDGEPIHRWANGDRFMGYLVRSLEITGPVFAGDASDARFCGRVAFGAAAARRCGAGR